MIRNALMIGALLMLAPHGADAQWSPYPPRYRYPVVIDDLRAAIRVEVSPKEAEVYIDGYYAGIVDDFDGTFQRLRLPPGPHEIVVRHAGFHSFKEDVYLSPDVVHRIRRNLEPLAAGEPEDPRPTPTIPPSSAGPGPYGPPGAAPSPPGPRRPPVQRMPPADPSAPAEPSTYGALVIRVQPGEAEIFIDGEQWEGPQGDERLVVQLPEGTHGVEVRKAGFATFSTSVQIRRGETVPLNVSLSRP